MKILLFPIILLVFNATVSAQNMDNTKPKIVLQKDSLIQLANEMLNSKYPSFKLDHSEYDVTAWSNSKKTIVKYRRIIQFTPLDKKDKNLDYDIEVDLTNQHILPFDFFGMDKFYIPTAEEEEKINFVIQAFGLPHAGFDISIIEDADMYRINLDNETSYGHYGIDKITGEECIGSIQSSYEPMPDDMPGRTNQDPLIEIRK